MRVSTQPGTKNSNYRDLMGRVLCLGSSGSDSVVLEPGSRVAATLPALGAPRTRPAERAKVRVGPGRSSARPGSWPPAPLTTSPLVPAKHSQFEGCVGALAWSFQKNGVGESRLLKLSLPSSAP